MGLIRDVASAALGRDKKRDEPMPGGTAGTTGAGQTSGQQDTSGGGFGQAAGRVLKRVGRRIAAKRSS